MLGGNQNRAVPYLIEFPQLPELIQRHINEGALIKDLPDILRDEHNIPIKLRSVEGIIKKHRIKTARKPQMDNIQLGAAILKKTQEDPLKRWGSRLVKEKLARDGIHVKRDFVTEFQREDDPEGAAARHPTTRKVHSSSLWSTGSNEVWGVDGHEKILTSMGIAIWGVIDKFSCMELGLWAVPNARLADVPPILYLRLVKKLGGMPITTTSDKGSEMSRLIPLVEALRKEFQPALDPDLIPAFRTMESVYNITRERNWRTLFEKELSNIQYIYLTNQVAAGYQPNNPVHKQIARWLWAEIVQLKLDELLKESQTHRIRYQKNINLPSGGPRIDFYERPERYHGKNELIAVPAEKVNAILEVHDKPELLCFGTPDAIAFCLDLYGACGSPKLSAVTGWLTFSAMVDVIGDRSFPDDGMVMLLDD